MIQTISYKDWFINQKNIPDSSSEEYESFYDFHRDLCLNGCYVEGEFFNPFLMWHLNFWHTEVDVLDDQQRIQQSYITPYLRDNEWVITNEIHRAEKEKKGLVILGIRRLAKSVIEASYIAHGATFDENSQNVIAGLNAPDIKLITDKIDKGLGFLPEAWKWQRIEDDWKKQVTLGVLTKQREKIPFSQIIIRNLDDGNNEEVIAGTKPRKLIIDEIGKGNFLRGLQAAIPGFTTPFGWGCSPILTGTGGDMKKFMDAKKIMFDVDQYNFLTYPSKKDPTKFHGLFIGAKYRMETKNQSNLADYLGKPGTLLSEIPILVSDEERAIAFTESEIENKKKAGDSLASLKEKMYYPIEVDDIFLNEDTNIFNIQSAKIQQGRIRALGNGGIPVELIHDGHKIIHEFSDKLPIMDYPIRNSDSKDAPVMIYEFPVTDPPYGLYVAGVDSYRTGSAKYSSSLGAVYIFKRMHEITGEKFQYMFVASYVARPDDKGHWDEQSRLLIKYYNAQALVENDEISFIDYMISKGDERYLVPQPDWLKSIIPGTEVKRKYGIHRSAEPVREFLHNKMKRYLDDVIYTEPDNEDGTPGKQYTGVSRILDPVLLEEIIQYTENGNFDRLIAAELAIAQAAMMDPIMKVSSYESDPRLKSYFNRKKIKERRASVVRSSSIRIIR